MLLVVPGWPLELKPCTPATWPARASVMLLAWRLLISSAFTTEAAPVNDFFVAVPKATTITSSNCLVSSDKLITIPFCAGTSRVPIPMNDTTSTAFGSASIENLPSTSVMVPRDVPFTCTDAPITGSSSAALRTVPEIVWLWAKTCPKVSIQTDINSRNFFIPYLK